MYLNSTSLKVAVFFTNVLNILPVLGLYFELVYLPRACSLDWEGLVVLPDEHAVKMQGYNKWVMISPACMRK